LFERLGIHEFADLGKHFALFFFLGMMLYVFHQHFELGLKVLMEKVEHHDEEEEEGKMFPKVRKLMDTETLEQLGEELEAAKDKQLRKAS